MATVTHHALQRYQERIAPVSQLDALAEIISHEPVIDKAAAFGCDTVILGNGVRLKLKGATVTTVLEKRGY